MTNDLTTLLGVYYCILRICFKKLKYRCEILFFKCFFSCVLYKIKATRRFSYYWQLRFVVFSQN